MPPKMDVLTGLQNRRGWEEGLQIEEARAKRYRHPSCVIIVDLDGLKEVNDLGGHKAGDELIRRTAGCIQGALRDVDSVVRLGGDEFAILGVECGEKGADALLRRIKTALAERGSPPLGVRRCATQTSSSRAPSPRRIGECT